MLEHVHLEWVCIDLHHFVLCYWDVVGITSRALIDAVRASSPANAPNEYQHVMTSKCQQSYKSVIIFCISPVPLCQSQIYCILYNDSEISYIR